MKKSISRTSLLIFLSCILVVFLVIACEQDSGTNTHLTNNGSQPVSSGTPATPATNTPSSTPTNTPSSDPELPAGSYSITYVLDGGSWIEGYTPTQIYTADDYISLPNAGKVHKDGYTFTGWYENSRLSFGFAKGSTGNKTYTAHWTEGTHTPVGYYNTGSGDTACDAGRYQDSIDSTNCSTCSAGTYQNNEGATGCFTTPAGSYSTAGASAPTPCDAGTYSTEGASSCTRCPAGKYSSAGSSTCLICPAGTISSTNRSSCVSCPTGKYSTAGSSACIASPAGTYISTTGARAPTPCPAGTYQDMTGQSSCKSCPEGTTSEEGSTSASACH